MLFFIPIRAQIKLHKWPVLTILIAILCIAIYVAQIQNEGRIVQIAKNYCTHKITAPELAVWGRLGQGPPIEACGDALAEIHTSPRPETLFAQLEAHLKQQPAGPSEAARVTAELRSSYYGFAGVAPAYLTGRLWMERPSWNPLRMLTATFAHASWPHVIFNLIFFFAFGATVELLLGPVLFLATIVLLSLGIGISDTLVHLSQETTVSLGLSGVVTGMLALFIYFVPRAKIQFFFWFLFSAGMVGVPGWFVGLWYIGGDLLRSLNQVHSQTNYIAHLSGAASGFLLGITLFRDKRHWARALVEDKLDLTQDESGWRKLNAFFAVPAILYFMFMAFLLGVGILLYFVANFWIQLLILLPVAVAMWQLYRMRRAKRPDHDHYQIAMACLERGETQNAMRGLEALARRGYARAMLQLASLYETGHGVVKNLPEAVRWYTHAAQRNNAEAQYRVGLMHAEGRGLRKDHVKTRDWWQRAVRSGHAQAAMSLGYICENTAGTREVREQAKEEAAKWYYLAGQLFLRRQRKDDARMAANALRGLEVEHPLALQLEAEIGTAASSVSPES